MIYLPDTEARKLFLLKWAQKILKFTYLENPYPIGVFLGEEEKLACVAVYHDWRHPHVMMSLASVDPHWATKKHIGALYSYAFTPRPVGLGVNRITVLCDKKNRRSRRFIKGIGFREEGCIRRGGNRGEDLILYGLLKNELVVKDRNISVEADIRKLSYG